MKALNFSVLMKRPSVSRANARCPAFPVSFPVHLARSAKMDSAFVVPALMWSVQKDSTVSKASVSIFAMACCVLRATSVLGASASRIAVTP